MFDLDQLYKKYLIYRFKKLLPLLMLLFISVFAGYYFYSTQFVSSVERKEIQKESQETEQKTQTQKKEPLKRKKEPLAEKNFSKQQYYYKFFTLSVREKNNAYIKKMQKRYKKLGLECNVEEQNNYLNLVCGVTNRYEEYLKIKHILQQNHIKYYVVKKRPEDIEKKKKVEVSQSHKKSIKLQEAVQSERKKSSVTKITHTDVDIKQLQKKFSQHKNYALAIRIAKEYYSQKEYQQSLTWSKKANTLDRKETESWIYYAKSLYALGEKEKAIKVLKLYKRFASSKKVDRILQGWQNDK